MRVWRCFIHTVGVFAITGLICAAVAFGTIFGLRWFGQWGPMFLCLPAMFIGLFLLILSDRTFK